MWSGGIYIFRKHPGLKSLTPEKQDLAENDEDDENGG